MKLIFDIFLGLDSRLDKQRFFESNNATFMIPKKFEYNPVRRDESESLVQKSVMDELEARKQKLKERLATLKVDSEGIYIYNFTKKYNFFIIIITFSYMYIFFL